MSGRFVSRKGGLTPDGSVGADGGPDHGARRTHEGDAASPERTEEVAALEAAPEPGNASHVEPDPRLAGLMPANIAVVRLGACGDVVRTLPAVAALAARFPAARLYWLVDTAWAPLLEGWAPLHRVVALPRDRGRGAGLRQLVAWRRLAASCRADLALDFHGNLRSGFVTRATGARWRVGHDGHDQREGNRRFTNVKAPAGPRRRARSRRAADLVATLGVDVAAASPPPPLPAVEARHREADELLDGLGLEPGRFVAILPATSSQQAYKRPPAAWLEATLDAVANSGRQALLLWGPGERELAAPRVRPSAQLAPATDLPLLGAVLAASAVTIGGDTGPLHLAAALGRPTIGLFGPTDPVINRPAGDTTIVSPPTSVYTGIKRHDRLIGFSGVEAEDVGQVIVEVLSRLRPRPAAR